MHACCGDKRASMVWLLPGVMMMSCPSGTACMRRMWRQTQACSGAYPAVTKQYCCAAASFTQNSSLQLST